MHHALYSAWSDFCTLSLSGDCSIFESRNRFKRKNRIKQKKKRSFGALSSLQRQTNSALFVYTASRPAAAACFSVPVRSAVLHGIQVHTPLRTYFYHIILRKQLLRLLQMLHGECLTVVLLCWFIGD